jgi:hypothetical protein
VDDTENANKILAPKSQGKSSNGVFTSRWDLYIRILSCFGKKTGYKFGQNEISVS